MVVEVFVDGLGVTITTGGKLLMRAPLIEPLRARMQGREHAKFRADIVVGNLEIGDEVR